MRVSAGLRSLRVITGVKWSLHLVGPCLDPIRGSYRSRVFVWLPRGGSRIDRGKGAHQIAKSSGRDRALVWSLFRVL